MLFPKLATSIAFCGISDIRREFYDEIKEIKRAGIDCVEVALGKAGGYKMHMEKCIERIDDGLKAVADVGLTLNSVHLPFQQFIYISSYDEGVRRFAVDEFGQLIEKCDQYTPTHYVFHPMTSRDKTLWPKRESALVQSFREMVAMTKANVCMENMVGSYPNTTDGVRKIMEQVDGGWCCLDTNHFLQEKPHDAIIALQKWIKTIHVSDYDGVCEQHWLPKQGVIEWDKVIGALDKIGYKGAFVYELDMEQGYTYADIKRNFESLFESYARHKTQIVE